ncbi:MAG: acyl-CoA dehydratase activase-related protein [Oscillospiraceae bacterium]|nr:acyl-CoA dehydratase activase-related protein [Oscillospiraceae bacterium]
MKVGIPKGLLYYKYGVFMKTFFDKLGAEIVVSPDTNRQILNEGVKYCVDEACLPIKVFHGHVSYLKDKCDVIFIPRIMSIREKEYICPKFCGLTEMIANSIPDLPFLLGEPIYWTPKEKLMKWALNTGKYLTNDKQKIKKALESALSKQNKTKNTIKQPKLKYKVALLGHPYSVYDPFLNMDLVKKLNRLNVEIITEDAVDDKSIDFEVNKLFKKPFWTFARNTYGAAVNLVKGQKIDGVVYISSFACGIDSVLIELIEHETPNLPFIVLKIDEHTGEAGFNTRIEAFADMLGRRLNFAYNNTAYG